MFYVKPSSNCEGLQLSSLETLLGGEWEQEPFWSGRPMIATGEDLEPRQVVGWSSLFGGSAVDVQAYRRLDYPQIALMGADWGVRVMANDGEEVEIPEYFAEYVFHLPAGWGMPILTIEDFSDITTDELKDLI